MLNKYEDGQSQREHSTAYYVEKGRRERNKDIAKLFVAVAKQFKKAFQPARTKGTNCAVC